MKVTTYPDGVVDIHMTKVEAKSLLNMLVFEAFENEHLVSLRESLEKVRKYL